MLRSGINTSAVLMVSLKMAGCASVEMASKDDSQKAKEFNAPSEGNAGLYVYRDSFAGKTHEISTESEFSSNKLELMFEAGKNYFVRQFIKMGLLVGGADIEVKTEEEGKADVAKLELAKAGTCSK